MEALNDREEKIMCPYNHAHYIRKSKMNGHLVKCAKNYPNLEMKTCDFNTTHRIPQPEMKHHLNTCPDRKAIEVKIIHEVGQDYNKYPVQNIGITGDECWDDYDVPAYNPSEYCKSNPVLRHLDVESAAKRKTFRKTERQRMNNLIGVNAEESCRDNRERLGGYNKKPNLPVPKPGTSDIDEEAPDSIEDLTARVQRGAKKTYIPHQSK